MRTISLNSRKQQAVHRRSATFRLVSSPIALRSSFSSPFLASYLALFSVFQLASTLFILFHRQGGDRPTKRLLSVCVCLCVCVCVSALTSVSFVYSVRLAAVLSDWHRFGETFLLLGVATSEERTRIQ